MTNLSPTVASAMIIRLEEVRKLLEELEKILTKKLSLTISASDWAKSDWAKGESEILFRLRAMVKELSQMKL